MYKVFISLLIFTAFHSYAQQPIKEPKLKQGLESVTGKTFVSPDSLKTISFIAANGEKFLCFEITVNATMDEAWKTIATEEGLKKWIAPVAMLDLKIGGSLKTNYNRAAKIDDKGTITLGIINYIPFEMLTYKITLNELFAEKCRREDQNLQEIIQLKRVDENKIMIISSMFGWGQGKEWDEAYTFFEKGNKWTMEKMMESFKK